MTKTHIALIARTSDRVEIVNIGGGAATVQFLEANRKHMDSVSFGHTGPGGASHSIKADRVARFIEFAERNGLKAEYRTHAEVWN